jgi:large subunit ribosomal protein L9
VLKPRPRLNKEEGIEHMANMQVILLEALQGVGSIGQMVKVKAGFARNFLLPRSKALVATKANIAKVEAERATLNANNATAKAAAEKLAEKHSGLTLTLSRFASETGQLYGSIKAKDLAAELAAKGLTVPAADVLLAGAIRDVGTHTIRVALHPEVIITVPVVVERQSQ